MFKKVTINFNQGTNVRISKTIRYYFLGILIWEYTEIEYDC